MKNLTFEEKYKKAADLVKWKRISIHMAAAVVTSDFNEAQAIVKKLKQAF